jgi:hypothetical protein
MAMVGAQQRARGTVEMGGSEREAEMDGERYCTVVASSWLRHLGCASACCFAVTSCRYCRCRLPVPAWCRRAGAGCRCRVGPNGDDGGVADCVLRFVGDETTNPIIVEP